LALLFAAAVWAQALAQTSPSPSASAQNQTASSNSAANLLVDQLVENDERNRATLPSLTARESILSKFDEIVVFGRSSDKAEATVRMVRKSPSEPLTQIRQYTALNGKPVKPGQHIVLPLDMIDSFSDIQSLFFSVQNRVCYSFTLGTHPTRDASLELSMTFNPDAATLPHCASLPKGRTGVARIDPTTHQLTRLEYTTSKGAEPDHPSAFTSVDYAPVKLGDKTFWLPAVETAHVVIDKTPLKWVSHYSDYHQYASSVTILPAGSEPQTP
jgi:hypothetical protein